MKKGLTLIEVMVAALIFSFISVALYMLLSTGISVRKKVEAKQGTYQTINLNLENIALSLRNVVFFSNVSAGFNGTIEDDIPRLEFYTQNFDYARGYPKVSLVKYRFESGFLYKEIKSPFDENEETTEVGIIDDLENFEIFYSDTQGTETKTWQDVTQIPKGVRISLEYKDEKGQSQFMKKHVLIYRDNEL
ncbi:MAG: type II secretion system protein GspJ [Candidatus Omnitrophota bacterium]|nr:prepilin-type N-terminal cleavage/methylation domain-containing protein [Candidatus Omnitrophota bacterium]